MAAVSLTPADLAPFAEIPQDKAEAMIADAMARAALAAPCILADGFEYEAAAKAIIRGAILRWHDEGSAGSSRTVTTGPFGVTDTRQARKGMFLQDELDDLKALCPGATKGAFSIDTAGPAGARHADVCSLNLGANYCSCGADLTLAEPLWEDEP